MRRLAGAVALVVALLPSAALGQEVNQGDSDYVFTMDNPGISCPDPTPGTKVEGSLPTTINIITDAPIDYVTIKSGTHAAPVEATFYNVFIWPEYFVGYGATITITQDVSNYVPWTCPPDETLQPLLNDYQEA
jgi:hypothetical protein